MAGGGAVNIPVEDLPKLPLDQLRQIKEQLSSELNLLNESINNIKTASARFDAASQMLELLKKQTEGQVAMIPLTSSLFVPGTLGNSSSVLVDVGTNYYIQKSLPKGVEYCERKITFLQSDNERVAELAGQKAGQVQEVNMVIQAKLRAAPTPMVENQ